MSMDDMAKWRSPHRMPLDLQIRRRPHPDDPPRVHCAICGRLRYVTTCGACGVEYCRDCASVPDEAGQNCPDRECPLFGLRERSRP